VKKLISIGVALALLAMVVVPGAVAAYSTPPTYAKVPFAIVQSGFELVGSVLGDLQPILTAAGFSLPIDLGDLAPIMNEVGGWAGGPLSWSVDMLAWGLELGEELWYKVDTAFGIGYPEIGDILTIMSCKLLMCWSATNCSGTFDPCASVP
jgi:hypothetical protein